MGHIWPRILYGTVSYDQTPRLCLWLIMIPAMSSRMVIAAAPTVALKSMGAAGKTWSRALRRTVTTPPRMAMVQCVYPRHATSIRL